MKSLSIYPNPAKEWVEVQCEYQIDQVIISNLQGQQQLELLKPLHNKLDVSSLPNGFYIISIKQKEQTDYQELIIQH